VFARKPAPVQITYLGYPTKTGLSTIDYRITDSQLDPPWEETMSSEKPVRLASGCYCYRPPATCPEVSRLLRAEAAGPSLFRMPLVMLLEQWGQDLRLAGRRLGRERGFTGAAVLSLAAATARPASRIPVI
jgi:hypothetical protein